MYFLIILIPLVGFLSCGFLGRFFGQRGAVFIPNLFMVCNTVLSIFLFCILSTNNTVSAISLGNWINSAIFTINWSFYIDNLTIMMLLIVNGVSTLVHIYSSDYMRYDAHLIRFISYLSLFTFFMLILITGNNLITIFLGWEGVGLCSYLLISFWFTRVPANKAAMKAMIVNRISDFGLTIGIICVFFVFKSVDIAVIIGLVPFLSENIIYILGNPFYVLDGIALLLFIGAMGKSAQLGLHTWLPDAMEGPTPVSALIHAATMVTAGVFLVIKTAIIFEHAPDILLIVSFIGAFTAFFAATAGLLQADLKKVIAYSTCSQLGYMFFVCGLSGYNFGLFHLINHAFFKALLFLSAGAVIHSIANEQDMRKFGGTLKLIPFTYTMVIIGSLSLMGFPFLTGFYSKDLILEIAYATYNQIGHALYWCGLITAFFTSFYSIRLLYLTFLASSQTTNLLIVKKIHDVPFWMMFSLSVLSLGSIFWGYLTKDFMVGMGTSFWNSCIFILPENNHLIEAELLNISIKLTPFICSLFIIIFVFFTQSISIYKRKKIALLNFWFHKKYNIIFWFLNNKWYFDTVYNKLLNKPLLKYSFILLVTLLDKGFLEMVGPRNGFTFIYMVSFKYILRQQSGLLFLYALSIGLTLILLILFFDYLNLFYLLDNY